jgi:Ulp1 family protease
MALSESSPLKLWLFPTFFFDKLIKGGPDSVVRWTKNQDVFEMDVIVIPVNADCHWFLIVVAQPGKLFERG